MNKNNYYLTAILALFITIPSITHAVLPAPSVGKEIQNELRNNFQDRIENARDNQQIRNDLLRKSQDEVTNTGSTIKDIRREGRDDVRNASSSIDRKEVRQNMRLEIYKLQLNKIVKEFNRALDNLKQIRARIASRIQKAEQSGRNMTKAKDLLIIADNKILTAQNAINILASSTATSTASTTIDLGKPRVMTDSVKNALKDAKDALNDVVRAVAHAMGLKLGLGDDSHASTTATSTATSTATTTP